MNEKSMQDRIDQVLAGLDAEQLEQRIAPVKCEKNPDAPECQPVAMYGVEPPVVRYGVGF
ncbi:MAG: hypothetical protein JXR83_02435 [Deltaproteobacteria bacterium]|nr:hypothetical protein [Deltaproteobacteria bacterium]